MKFKILLTLAAVVSVTAMVTMTIHCATVKKTKEYKVKDVDKTQTMFVYQFRSYAWKYQDYAYLISPDGDVVYVDINKEKGKDFKAGSKEALQFFDEFKKNQKDENHFTVTSSSDSLIKKGINVGSVKLKESKGKRVDGGIEMYYGVKGTGKSRKLVLLEEAGEQPKKATNKDVLRVVKYMKKALKEAREQEADIEKTVKAE